MRENTTDILAGFDTYAAPDEITETTASDSPATTIPCSALASYASAKLTC